MTHIWKKIINDPIASIKYYRWISLNFLLSRYNIIFNPVVKRQSRDLKSIPIILINYNQLFHLKKLVDFLLKKKFHNIVIIDNCSTYPDLLEYYRTLNFEPIKIIIRERNDGHNVLWNDEKLFKAFGKGYYIVSDVDIIPVAECPDDFLENFLNILKNNPRISKVGFSLKLDDIPNSNKNKSIVLKQENRFWLKKDSTGNYLARIDTTFALYPPRNQFNKDYFFEAIRTSPPYTATHGGWYIDSNNLSEEQIFYNSTANSSASWRVSLQGDLVEKSYENL